MFTFVYLIHYNIINFADSFNAKGKINKLNCVYYSYIHINLHHTIRSTNTRSQ